jgi:hypothetical protein
MTAYQTWTLFRQISKYIAWHYLEGSLNTQLDIISKITSNCVTILRTLGSCLTNLIHQAALMNSKDAWLFAQHTIIWNHHTLHTITLLRKTLQRNTVSKITEHLHIKNKSWHISRAITYLYVEFLANKTYLQLSFNSVNILLFQR